MNLRNQQTLCLAVVLAALFSTAELSWATDDVKVCIKYETHFSDWEMGDFYAYSSPHDYVAIQPHVRVKDNDSGVVVYNDYTNVVNCTPTLALNSTHDFEIKVYAEALLVDNNEIRVYENYNDPIFHAQVVHPDWNPTGDGSFPFVHQYNSEYKVSNVLAAAGWTVNRRPAGLSNLDITYFTDPCPSTGTSCFQVNGGNHRIMLSSDDLDKKATIAHETGHEMSYQKNDNDGHTNDCSYYVTGNDDCSDGGTGGSQHCNRCIEYQSCAAWEGFADFYMVAAWNYEGDSDCDYDKNGTSCENEGAWMESHLCCLTCNGYGMEWDWTHFWWDMYTDAGLSVGDIAEIYNLSNPEYWNSGIGVYDAIHDAAMDFGVNSSVWNNVEAINGIAH